MMTRIRVNQHSTRRRGRSRVVFLLLLLVVGLQQWDAAATANSNSEGTNSDQGNNYSENEPNDFEEEPPNDDDFDETDYSFAHPIFEDKGVDIQNYLSDYIFDQPHEVFEDMRSQLERSKVVIIRNAFQESFAQAMHEELNERIDFNLYNGSSDDGFAYHHHNTYDHGNYSAFMNQIQRIFTSPETKEFMTQFLDVDCFGKHTLAAPSYYAPGDFSNPHSDHHDQRNVAFIWHLTKDEDWKPEWGGALYWCLENPEHSYLFPTFNTLILFMARPQSQHLVTRVSHNATAENGAGKRLAYNGWWESSWEPHEEDDLEGWLGKFGDRLTMRQFEELWDIVHNYIDDEDRSKRLIELHDDVFDIRYPQVSVKYEIDANNLGNDQDSSDETEA